ncbi:MAG: hypothetical protein IIA07_07945 [Proteobacteria bacterium]|nr:hypothetical protein [Pseudomonadota bacterium]
MRPASQKLVPACVWARRTLCACAMLALSTAVIAAGTPAGTVIENTATVSFDLAGTPLTITSNTTTITVVERIDVVVTLQSAQILVAPNDTNRTLLFRVTNMGNGTETFALAIDSSLSGDDFDPVPTVPPIFFDTDGSGDFNVGDLPYNPGVNDPVLPADGSVDIFLVNDIPGTVANGEIGLSQLTATSLTGIGAPGTEYTGQGDGGVDAIIGTSGGEDLDVGEYLVSEVQISVIKAQAVSDPFGGTQALPGATITYTITVEVTSSGTATASVLRDLIPTFSTYLPNSITLNAAAVSDATDADAGEFDTSGAPTVVVRLGDLTQADGLQTVIFEVTID